MPVNITINELAISVFQKSVDECSIDELQQLAHEYPYFGPAQLLLAKKLQSEDDTLLYEDQVQKTSLYFPNRVWLDHLLNGKKTEDVVTDYSPIIKEQTTPTENNQPVSAPVIEPIINETIIAEPPVNEPVINEQVIVEPYVGESINNEPAINENKEIETEVEPVKDDISDLDEPVIEESTEKAPELPAFKIEPLAPGVNLTFEPYHTVDYFASQGIKAKEEDKPADSFSRQLKSFTEWLKTMKRLPVTEISSSVPADTATERKVEQMAEHSIAERHVITEAMAEVWVKQGNTEKAAEIYRKLSLLDPPKSSYFAAKIEELKKTS
jgi:hypothetical protein